MCDPYRLFQIYLKFKFTTTDLDKRLTIVAFQNSHLAETQVENFPKSQND